MSQIKNSFDQITLKKIAKSLGYAMLSGVATGLTCYTQTRDVKIAIITGVSALISFIVNVPVEYRNGVEENGER